MDLTKMTTSRPCQELLGLDLDGGWKVTEKLSKQIGATGSCFSQGYIVEAATGKKAFLKAIDYWDAMFSVDPPSALNVLTASFLFERDVLRKCKRFDRVVSAILDGNVSIPDFGPFGNVAYLIFEKAESDVRAFSAYTNQFDTAYSLRALHHIAVGLKQLHSAKVAHQDVKPSDVLVFDGNINKLADLGRAAAAGEAPPHEGLVQPGDPGYAPPEQLYGYMEPNWNTRRLGCDAYHLGSMAVYFFTGMPTTQILSVELHDTHRWGKWAGDYSGVLPYVRDAFNRVMEVFEQSLPDEIKDNKDTLVKTVRELCEPDPARRGNPKRMGRGDNPLQMDIYVTRFDLLARSVELRM